LKEMPDLAEEVARLSGLEEIPATLPPRIATPALEDHRRAFMRSSRDIMLGCGLTEIKTIAFISPGDNRRFPGLDGGTPVAVANPISAESGEMRLSLIPGLLAALRFNLNHEAEAFHAFEIAKVFNLEKAGRSNEGERLAEITFGTYALEGIAQPGVKAKVI